MHPISEGNGEQVLVGKLSFGPSEVLGHGSAGTFVFRFSLPVFHLLKLWLLLTYDFYVIL